MARFFQTRSVRRSHFAGDGFAFDYRSNYGFYVLFLTPFVVLMIDTVIPGDWEVALVRIFDTLIGGAIALAVTYILRPRIAVNVPEELV